MFIHIIPYNKMRYNSVGDYYQINGHWHFYIANLPKKRYSWLVCFHEIIECYLCWWLGIKEEDIYNFDIAYEAGRKYGDNSEPGNSRLAPYFWEHQIATFFERILAFILFVSWTDYDQAINDL